MVNNGLLFWYLIIRSPKITGKLTSSEVKTKQTNKQANTHTHTKLMKTVVFKDLL